MPLFMDVHHKVEGLTAEAVAGAHKRDLETQGKYGVNYRQYWFDEGSGKVFCLVDAPDAETATKVHREARRLGAHMIDGHLMAPIHTSFVQTLRLRGEQAAAIQVTHEVLGLPWGAGDATYLAHLFTAGAGAAADLAVIARSERRPAHVQRWANEAAALVREAEGSAGRLPSLLPPARASLAATHAELARAQGSAVPEEWAAVAERWGALGDRYEAACARLRQAEAELTLRRRSAASRTLAGVQQVAVDVGAAHLRLTATELATRAGLPDAVPSAAVDRFGLSARERDVLTLVAEGRTDRQIGEQLFISHRTVERHVSNILAKLDARTRAQVAAIAHRDGLVPIA